MPKWTLNISSDEINSIKQRSEYTISIIGCKRNGILHACLFAEAGFKVMCVDADRAIVDNITSGRAYFLKREAKRKFKKHVKDGLLKSTSDIKSAVAKSDVILITTKATIDKKKRVSYLSVERVCKQVGSSLQRGSLVIILSLIGLATTQDLIKEILENTSGFKVGVDLGLAYNPISISDRQTLEKLEECRRTVAATDGASIKAASTILGTIAKNGIVKTSDAKSAEAAKLFESMQHHASIAMANEFAIFCDKAGIDYLKARELAETNGHNALALPTLTCSNAHEEAHLLLEEAENLNVKLRVPAAAGETSEDLLKHVIGLIREALRDCRKTLRRANISLFGISQTSNTRTAPRISARRLAKTLETKGAKISFYDPYLSKKEIANLHYTFSSNLTDAMKRVDCIVILTGHKRFKRLNLKKLKILARMPAAVVDLASVIDSKKVEKRGFTYRGLGRGVQTK